MAKSSSQYRIDVVPLTPLFGKRDPRFSYSSSEPITSGSLVAISFGKRDLTGVVLGSAPLPLPVPVWMKAVGQVILPSYLTPGQIALATSMSEQLFTQLGLVFKLFFPMQHAPRQKSDAIVEKNPTKVVKVRPKTRRATTVPKEQWEGMANERKLFERIQSYIGKSIKSDNLLLVLVPEILSAELYGEKLLKRDPTLRVGILTSARTPRETFLICEQIRDKKLDVVIGTRQAVFAPYTNLARIVIIDSEKRVSFTQWEMSPR